MNRIMKVLMGCVGLVVTGAFIATADITITNQGQVITIRRLADVASTNADTDLYQDFSIYPSRLGESGKIIRFYDFSKQGGSTSAIKLLPANPIPGNLIIRNGYVKTLTGQNVSDVRSNGLYVVTAGDIVASASNNWSTAGALSAIVPVGTASTTVSLLGTNRYLCLSTDGATNTAGKFMVVLDVEVAPAP